MSARERAEELSRISKISDVSIAGGIITQEEHREIKAKVRDMELDNLFKAMAAFCK